MANDEQSCYVYIQLPGTMETVPCASLKVRAVGAGGLTDSQNARRKNYWLDRGRLTASPGLPHLDDSDRPSREP